MSQPTERTILLTGERKPQYVFDFHTIRERKYRVRQFQCCLCAIFLCIFLFALILTVSYSLNSTYNNNSTNQTNISNASIDSMLILLTQSMPISDVKQKSKICTNHTEWDEAITFGQKSLRHKKRIERNIPSLRIQSPSYRHQKIVATSEKGRNISKEGYVEEYATRYVQRNKAVNDTIPRLCNNETLIINGEICPIRKMSCNIFQKYRSYNGSCNNLKFPSLYGVAYRPFRRALPPEYSDGISKPRTSVFGKPLPSARTVSLVVHRPYYKNDPKFTVMLAVWGQFLDHDITATALSQKSNGSTISCCNIGKVNYSECFPLYLDHEDPFTKHNTTCIEFVRSAPAQTCCLGPREQLNQVTSFIDGSVVYSADKEIVKNLRAFENGFLKMYTTVDGRTLLPISMDPNDGCNREEQIKNGKYCFASGDARANENLHLTSMHLIWARHHNLLAKKLFKINPHWDDEKIFQEVRIIIGAQMQHISYNEFLPILLGATVMEKFDLSPHKEGYFTKYNESVDSSIANNFATAAFRFAHTIIPGLMKLLANDTSSVEFVQLHKMLLDPFQLYESGKLDRALRGAMNTSIEANDAYFTDELKQHLFETSEQQKMPKQCGLDLVSLNIQRGRDHGLPGYTKWRKHCRLRGANNFDDLREFMDHNSLYNIRTIYRDVEDIDLYTGALSEIPLESSILGPTLTCLILDQFVRLKYGDRFWYENPQIFTKLQLKEIHKTTLGKIICDNSDDVEYAQPRVMENVKTGNKNTLCSILPGMNLEFWKESFTHVTMKKQLLSVIKNSTVY